MTHQWKYVLTDLLGTQLGEVTNASDRVLSLPLNGLPTAGFGIPSNHYLAPYLEDPSWDGLLKVYRDGTLVFCGPVVTSDDQSAGSGQTIKVTASGPLWRLGFRLLGTDAAGWSLGTAAAPLDLGFIAQQMLATANAGGYTGISAGTLVASSPGAAGQFFMQPIDQSIVTLSTGAASFDFEIAPVEPTNIGLGWPHIGTFNCVPLIGTLKSNAIFEFGTTRANLTAYGNTIDRTKLLTHGYINQPAATDHSGILTSTDAAAEATRGRFEGVVDDGGVQWDSLRQALVDKNVQVRKQARRLVSLKPVQNCPGPIPLVDFIVGDQIRARIQTNRLSLLDVTVRVWALNFIIDASGNEDCEIVTTPPSS